DETGADAGESMVQGLGLCGTHLPGSREIASSFTTRKWMADVTLRISSAHFDALSASLLQPAISIAETLSDRLGIPRPVLMIVADKSLASSFFEVVVAGAVRCCASLDTPRLDWLRQFPAAGPYSRIGNTNLASAGPAAS